MSQEQFLVAVQRMIKAGVEKELVEVGVLPKTAFFKERAESQYQSAAHDLMNHLDTVQFKTARQRGVAGLGPM